jgi:methylphosphotriester-DNA--protein-cysteine methyltransferase
MPPAARSAIARGGYVKNRVFFADEATAIAAGYRPCATCLPGKYKARKAANTPRNGPPSPHPYSGNAA